MDLWKEELSRVIQEVFKKHGVCTLAVIQSAVEGSPIAASAPKEMFESTLESMASAIRGVRFFSRLYKRGELDGC